MGASKLTYKGTLHCYLRDSNTEVWEEGWDVVQQWNICLISMALSSNPQNWETDKLNEGRKEKLMAR